MHRRTVPEQPRSIKSLRSAPGPNNTLRLASSERTDPSPLHPSSCPPRRRAASSSTVCRGSHANPPRDRFDIMHISSKYETVATVFACFWLEDDREGGGGGIASKLFRCISRLRRKGEQWSFEDCGQRKNYRIEWFLWNSYPKSVNND